MRFKKRRRIFCPVCNRETRLADDYPDEEKVLTCQGCGFLIMGNDWKEVRKGFRRRCAKVFLWLAYNALVDRLGMVFRMTAITSQQHADLRASQEANDERLNRITRAGNSK